jgi:light-regulated signal transduction histidine kinase (bacteriophytochrome)
MVDPILTNCDREQIHIPGSIQPYGALLVVGADGTISQASENVIDVLGIELHEVLGSQEALILGEGLPDTFNFDGKAFDITRRPYLAGQIVELEPQQSAEESRIFRLLHRCIGRLRPKWNVRDAAEEVAKNMREICGFDRVMVYRFLADDSGEVIAEEKLVTMSPYLGHHFPESDIPKQARALYVRNWTRLIANVNQVPCPIHPVLDPSNGLPLDLSDCTLRTVSPTHIQYLKNMGVVSSVSIVVEGRLWGLIACHHSEPRIGSKALRQGSELLGQVISIQMAAIETKQFVRQRNHTREIFKRLGREMKGTATIADALTRDPSDLLDLVGATGAAFVDPEVCRLVGATPREREVRELIEHLADRCQAGPVGVTCLTDELPGAGRYAQVASGVIALCYSRVSSSYLLWFRPEYIETITWAGEPKKPYSDSGPNSDFGPRASFDSWVEDVYRQCRPWTAADLTIVTEMKAALQEEELTMLNSVLEQRLAERAASLDRALDELTDFTYTVAHDLRTPLRGMISNSRIIFEDYAGDISDGLKTKLRSIESNALKMASLIDDLLGFASLNRRDLEPKLLDISKLALNAAKMILGEEPKVGMLDLTIQAGMYASADKEMVEKLLEILIENAIKYRHKDRPAKVEVGEVDRVFFVRNEGVGFDPAYAHRLFKAFERFHREGEYSGNGIGLANAKRIVERHGGEIHTETKMGEGATFYFTLGRGKQ